MTARDKALGERLAGQGLVRPEALDHAREHQALVGGRLDSVILDLGLLGEPALLEALSEVHNAQPVSAVELDAVDAAVARLITPRIAARFELVPFRREGNRLHVAAVNPGDLMVEDELALLTGSLVTSYVALEARLYEVLARFYGVQRSPLLARVGRRLRGEVARPGGIPPPPPPTLRPTVAVHAPTAPARPSAEPDTPTAPAPWSARTQSELELSTEDLELFPSLSRLRSTGADAAAADQHPPVRVQPSPTLAFAPSPPPAPEPPPPAPPEPPAATTPDERLTLAAEALQEAEMREEIADVLLDFCEPYLRRRMVLAVRTDGVIGWRGEGEGVDPEMVRAISIPLSEPSVFVGLSKGMAFWLGALPPMPRNLELTLGLGGERPRDCVILPVTLKQKTVCFIYGDNLGDGVGGVPLSALRRLAAKAGLAFQVYLMKGKIRTL